MYSSWGNAGEKIILLKNLTFKKLTGDVWYVSRTVVNCFQNKIWSNKRALI